MTKYSLELKLKAVLAFLEGADSFRTVAKQFNTSLTPLKHWVAHYKEHGIEGLMSTYTNYDISFKMDVLNYMNILECLVAMQQLCITLLLLLLLISG